MREIKFRAWLINHKKMVDVNEINFERKQIFFKDVESPFLLYTFKFELMQYTGIKDKNEKEIYEGDILETNEDTLLCIEWYNELHCLIIKEIGCDFRWYLNKVLNDCFIIGNIYENPELLEKK